MLSKCLHFKDLLLEDEMKVLIQLIMGIFLKYWIWWYHIMNMLQSDRESSQKCLLQITKNPNGILHVFSNKVKKAICEEISDAKFCLIVDESRDESMREQMTIFIRFVDKDGFVRERFFGVVHVLDTSALTLKDEIYSILSHHSLDIQDIRGQGYDSASNMQGEWNGLKALVSNDCSYAYYINCFAHRLQLALVAASKEVILVQSFFKAKLHY